MVYDPAHQEIYIGSTDSQEVLVISSGSIPTLVATLNFSKYGGERNMAYDPVNQEIYAPTGHGPYFNVSAINTTTDQITLLDIPGPVAQSMSYDPANQEMYFGSNGGEYVLNRTNGIAAIMPFSGNSAFDPGNNQTFITEWQNGRIYTVAPNNTQVAALQLGYESTYPWIPVYDPVDHDMYVPDEGGNISVMNSTDQLVTDIRINTTCGCGNGWMSYDPANKGLYYIEPQASMNSHPGVIALINASSNSVVANLQFHITDNGSTYFLIPVTCIFDPVSNDTYVIGTWYASAGGLGGLVVINSANRVIENVTNLPSLYASFAVFDPSNSKIYVMDDGELSVITPNTGAPKITPNWVSMILNLSPLLIAPFLVALAFAIQRISQATGSLISQSGVQWLRITSIPIDGIPFELDGKAERSRGFSFRREFKTPMLIAIPSGEHKVKVQGSWPSGGVSYRFQKWSNGSLDPKTTFQILGLPLEAGDALINSKHIYNVLKAKESTLVIHVIEAIFEVNDKPKSEQTHITDPADRKSESGPSSAGAKKALTS